MFHPLSLDHGSVNYTSTSIGLSIKHPSKDFRLQNFRYKMPKNFSWFTG
jgi:hypothetical protein